MSDLYNKIENLCKRENITITQLCKDLNISRSSLSELNAGRTKQLSVSVMRKIADYFNVSVDWLNDLTKYRNDKELKEFSWKEYDMIEKFPGYGDYFDPTFDFGELIKERREKQRISTKEMAGLIGCSENEYLQVEAGERPLKQEQAELLCHNLFTTVKQVLIEEGYIEETDTFDVETDEDVMNERYIRDSLTYPEIEHIKKYRTLDKYGKKAIDDLLNNEFKRCVSSEEKKPLPTIKIKHSVYKASAGFGFDLEDRDEWDEIDIPDTPEAHNADFAVTIFGNSMEPIYHDSDIVLVKIQDRVNIGETGIFVVNGQGYIKQYGGDRLISVNSDYDDIVFTDGDFIKCAGKVIGIA